jgi:hypothetical protein
MFDVDQDLAFIFQSKGLMRYIEERNLRKRYSRPSACLPCLRFRMDPHCNRISKFGWPKDSQGWPQESRGGCGGCVPSIAQHSQIRQIFHTRDSRQINDLKYFLQRNFSFNARRVVTSRDLNEMIFSCVKAPLTVLIYSQLSRRHQASYESIIYLAFPQHFTLYISCAHCGGHAHRELEMDSMHRPSVVASQYPCSLFLAEGSKARQSTA